MIDIPRVTPLEKIDILSPRSYQLQIASLLVMGLCAHLPFFMQGFIHLWFVQVLFMPFDSLFESIYGALLQVEGGPFLELTTTSLKRFRGKAQFSKTSKDLSLLVSGRTTNPNFSLSNSLPLQGSGLLWKYIYLVLRPDNEVCLKRPLIFSLLHVFFVWFFPIFKLLEISFMKSFSPIMLAW